MVKSPKTLVFCFCTVVVLLCFAVLFSTCVRDGNVPDDGEGIANARVELEQIGRELEDQRGNIKKAAGAITDSQRTAETLEQLERSDGELIAESRDILTRIRERTEAQASSSK
jgi:hypothetical protein